MKSDPMQIASQKLIGLAKTREVEAVCAILAEEIRRRKSSEMRDTEAFCEKFFALLASGEYELCGYPGLEVVRDGAVAAIVYRKAILPKMRGEVSFDEAKAAGYPTLITSIP